VGVGRCLVFFTHFGPELERLEGLRDDRQMTVVTFKKACVQLGLELSERESGQEFSQLDRRQSGAPPPISDSSAS
jgi:hypothetical protein